MNIPLHKKERWKKIPNLDGTYYVSSFGRIRRKVKFKFTTVIRYPAVQLDDCGYERINIYPFGNHANLRIHTAVALAFLGPCPKGKEVNHKDLDNTNNYYKNLEYKTHKGNIKYSVKAGMYANKVGESASASIFTDKEVMYIRKKYGRKYGNKDGICSHVPVKLIRKLKNRYDCSYGTIYNMLRGTTYSEVRAT